MGGKRHLRRFPCDCWWQAFDHWPSNRTIPVSITASFLFLLPQPKPHPHTFPNKLTLGQFCLTSSTCTSGCLEHAPVSPKRNQREREREREKKKREREIERERERVREKISSHTGRVWWASSFYCFSFCLAYRHYEDVGCFKSSISPLILGRGCWQFSHLVMSSTPVSCQRKIQHCWVVR